jgi:hypothetical protein
MWAYKIIKVATHIKFQPVGNSQQGSAVPFLRGMTLAPGKPNFFLTSWSANKK